MTRTRTRTRTLSLALTLTLTLALTLTLTLTLTLSRSVSFSYGKALQKTTIVTWMGDVRNNGIAQDAILNRCKANHEACQGTYVKGSCASVSVDGNIAQAAGAY